VSDDLSIAIAAAFSAPDSPITQWFRVRRDEMTATAFWADDPFLYGCYGVVVHLPRFL
jgi:hypothetical protein